MHSLLFVCHGNICRSTMAEFVMKELVRQAGRAEEFCIASAARSREEIGNDTHSGTKEQLEKHGIPFTRRHAVQIKRSDYDQYDLILVFDQENIREVRRICGPDAEHKVYSLADFAHLGRDIADPWYTGDFVRTYDDVSACCQALLAQLERTKGDVLTKTLQGKA